MFLANARLTRRTREWYGPANTMVLGAENARVGHISPPAFATRDYFGIADTGYRKYMPLLYLRKPPHPLLSSFISSAQTNISAPPTPPSAYY